MHTHTHVDIQGDIQKLQKIHPDLRRNVLSGKIPPDLLVMMTAEEVTRNELREVWEKDQRSHLWWLIIIVNLTGFRLT